MPFKYATLAALAAFALWQHSAAAQSANPVSLSIDASQLEGANVFGVDGKQVCVVKAVIQDDEGTIYASDCGGDWAGGKTVRLPIGPKLGKPRVIRQGGKTYLLTSLSRESVRGNVEAAATFAKQ